MGRIKNKIFLLILVFFSCLKIFPSTKIECRGRKIYLNSEIFVVRGVCYSPIPVGKNPSNYRWWDEKNFLLDIPKIKQLGANVIRTYSAPQSYNANFAEFLDECYKNGIYVIVGYWVNYGQNFADPDVRSRHKQNFLNMVNLWKNYPAVIIWCFGNEVYPGGGSSWKDWYSLIKEVSQEVKNIDSAHLLMNVVTTDHFYSTVGEISYGSDDENLSLLDLWGINAYLGYDFKNLFFDYKNKTSKPLIITEFGCDSWNKIYNKEDEFMQANYIVSQWRDIQRNLILNNGVASGGCIFEWTDEWWKSFSNSSDYKQDTSTDWTNFNYEDPNMNEEWFGIMKISSNSYTSYITTAKRSYYEIQKLWKKYVFIEEKKVYAYPNPALNCEFVRFRLPYDAKEINIYTISAELVKTIKVNNIFDTRWYMDNNNYEEISCGVYIFTVKTKNSNIYKNKIVVIK